jgi:hypothetical protein
MGFRTLRSTYVSTFATRQHRTKTKHKRDRRPLALPLLIEHNTLITDHSLITVYFHLLCSPPNNCTCCCNPKVCSPDESMNLTDQKEDDLLSFFIGMHIEKSRTHAATFDAYLVLSCRNCQPRQRAVRDSHTFLAFCCCGVDCHLNAYLTPLSASCFLLDFSSRQKNLPP